MDTTLIITNLVPAIMLFIIGMIVRFFPPTRDNGGIIGKVPKWWGRDQYTWNTAHKLLAKHYLIYSLVLAAFCIGALIFETTYGSTLGYVLLIVFFVLSNFQVRSYMKAKLM